MQLDKFNELLGDNIVILGHHNADPDAIGAAVATAALIEYLKPSSTVAVLMPKDISTLSEGIIEALELDIHEDFSGSYDTIIVVDAGSLNQLGDWEEEARNSNKLIVIDHHSHNDEVESLADLYLIIKEASSTSEIVYRLMKQAGVIPSETIGKALLAGVMFDSKFFSIGSADMFQAISELLDVVGDVSEVKSLFNTDYTVPEKIARLKAAQRSTIQKTDGWIIAYSELGSYQSSGARALLSLGADIAIVSGEEKEVLRSSLRTSNKFHTETGIHLGDVISKLSKELDGEGSGHPTAAGFNGTGTVEDFTKIVVARLKKFLENRS